MSELATLKADLDRVKAELNKPSRPATEPYTGPGLLPAEPKDDRFLKSFGYDSFADFIGDVKMCPSFKVPTERMAKAHETIKKSATGMGELIGSDGGFLVPPQFSTKIFERMYADNSLLAKTDQYPVTGNSMVFPRNAESSRADGSRWGGVRTYWVQEGATITASNPTFGKLQMNLHKMACLVAVTSELKQDAPTLETYLNRVFAAEMSFETGKAIFRGNGVGRPLGFLNAACAVTVSKETGQAAATIVHENIEKMWARRFALGGTGNYMWLINQDVGPALNTMTLPVGTGGVTTYLPPGQLSAPSYSTLKGAPVMEVEWASTLGTVGDIALVDLSQYVTISNGGPSTTNSMHVYFTTDQEAIKTTWRIDGQPWQATALTPYSGTSTQSPFVLLETRS